MLNVFLWQVVLVLLRLHAVLHVCINLNYQQLSQGLAAHLSHLGHLNVSLGLIVLLNVRQGLVALLLRMNQGLVAFHLNVSQGLVILPLNVGQSLITHLKMRTLVSIKTFFYVYLYESFNYIHQ